MGPACTHATLHAGTTWPATECAPDGGGYPAKNTQTQHLLACALFLPASSRKQGLAAVDVGVVGAMHSLQSLRTPTVPQAPQRLANNKLIALNPHSRSEREGARAPPLCICLPRKKRAKGTRLHDGHPQGEPAQRPLRADTRRPPPAEH